MKHNGNVITSGRTEHLSKNLVGCSSARKVGNRHRTNSNNRVIPLSWGTVSLLIFFVSSTAPAMTRSSAVLFDKHTKLTESATVNKIKRAHYPIAATLQKAPILTGGDLADIEETMDKVAAEHNMVRNHGTVTLDPMEKDIVKRMTDNAYRYVKSYCFCNEYAAATSFHHSVPYPRYSFCRISVAQDTAGRYWLISLHIDLTNYDNKLLSDDLKWATLEMKFSILDIMYKTATGEF